MLYCLLLWAVFILGLSGWDFLTLLVQLLWDAGYLYPVPPLPLFFPMAPPRPAFCRPEFLLLVRGGQAWGWWYALVLVYSCVFPFLWVPRRGRLLMFPAPPFLVPEPTPFLLLYSRCLVCMDLFVASGRLLPRDYVVLELS